jgi:hypothetical protein
MTHQMTSDTETQQQSGTVSTADLAYGNRTTSNTGNDVQQETVSQGSDNAPLFSSDQADEFKSCWRDVQAAFVDDPQQAVQRADGLVAETMKRLAEIFADERQKLENQWSSGSDVSTEDLRLALQRYRSFFDRLLSV